MVVILGMFHIANAQKKSKLPKLIELDNYVSVTFVQLPTGVKVREFETPEYPFGNWRGGKTVEVEVEIKNGQVVRAVALTGNPILRRECEIVAKKIKFEAGSKPVTLLVRYVY